MQPAFVRVELQGQEWLDGSFPPFDPIEVPLLEGPLLPRVGRVKQPAAEDLPALGPGRKILAFERQLRRQEKMARVENERRQFSHRLDPDAR
jgi:hypothetical protein